MLVSMSSVFQDQLEVLRRTARALGTLPVRGVITTGRAVNPVDVPAPAVASAPSVPQPDAVPVMQDETIYTATDATVDPPVLVRPVLPKEPPPGLPADQIGSIEVLVDEQGDVEQVRLFSPANRFHERMLMSAAKMWKFRPAFKDGHPVRYRTRIRITV